MPLLAGPFQSQWDAGVAYVAGNVVFDRGGWWLAVAGSTNSRPVCGNTDWTLVAGTPYVDVPMTAVALNHWNSSPLPIVSAPGAGLVVLPVELVGIFTPGTIGYPLAFESGTLQWMLGASPLPTAIAFSYGALEDSADFVHGVDTGLVVEGVWLPKGNPGSVAGLSLLTGMSNQPLLLQTTGADATGSLGISTVGLVVGAPGTNYVPLDYVSVDGGADAQIQIDSVNGTGGVVTFHLVISGTGYTATTGVTTTAQTGIGTGFTVDIANVGDGDGTLQQRVYYRIIPTGP